VNVVAVADGTKERVFSAAFPGLLSSVIDHRGGDVVVELPRLHQRARPAANDVSGQGACLVVDVDEALFREDARKQLPSRNRPDTRGIEIMNQWQAFDDVTEMHFHRGQHGQRDRAVEDEVSELCFALDVPRPRCIHFNIEDALVRRFGDHRAPDIEQPRLMLGHIHGRTIVDLEANRPSGLCRLGWVKCDSHTDLRSVRGANADFSAGRHRLAAFDGKPGRYPF
jgi:hypothetical protein